MQGIKHLKVRLFYMDQIVDGAELTGYNRLQKKREKVQVIIILVVFNSLEQFSNRWLFQH